MFSSGPIETAFVADLTAILALNPIAIAKRLVLSELLNIESGSHNSFGTNTTTIELIENDRLVSELVLLRRADRSGMTQIQSIANETCLMPVCGRMQISEYSLDTGGEIEKPGVPVPLDSHDIYLFAKTSDCKKLYTLMPEGELCVFLSTTWKAAPDDYFVTYDRSDLRRLEVVSTNPRESRVQFWLTFHAALRQNISRELLQSLRDQAETVKLQHFLTEILDEADHVA